MFHLAVVVLAKPRPHQPIVDCERLLETVGRVHEVRARVAEQSEAERALPKGVDLATLEQHKAIDAIFELIPTADGRAGHAVEFGYGYQYRTPYLFLGLNTVKLVRRGWRVDFFDAVIEHRSKDLNITRAALTYSTIAAHFEAAGIPRHVDYVSIDVDSIDVWLLLGDLT
jgi:hypothetical protein